MGTDGFEVVDTLPNSLSFKAHRTMCTELKILLDRILRIFPDIEAARPGPSSGKQALCLLNSAVDKAKQLLQHCSESSKLYLALTGDKVLSKCQKAKKSLEKSLVHIQGLVPVMLAAEISRIVDDLECVTFVLDSAEEEAGKVMKELLQHSSSTSHKDSIESSEIKSLQFVAPRLNITSPTTISIETRSIKKLLSNVGPNDQPKRMILRYLLYLLKKYGNLITGEQLEVSSHSEGPVTTENSSHDSQRIHHVEPEPCLNYGQCRTNTSNVGRVTPPEEYNCPVSLRLMFDPVIIASGVTYERVWIQKWFDEGNTTCPKTKKKLSHRTLTPNNVMKDLILKWCRANGVSIPQSIRQAEDIHSWEASFTSIRSFGSSMNDLNLPMDLSNMSLGSLGASYNSDSLHAKASPGLNLMSIRTSDNSHRHQSHSKIPETHLMHLSKLHDLQWDSQCQVIEAMKSDFKCNPQAFCSVSTQNLIEPLMRFLSTAYDQSDAKALRAGTQLLLEFLNNGGNGLNNLSEETYSMLATLLDSEVVAEALVIMEELSGYWHHKAKNAAFIALTSVIKILDSGNKEFQRKAIIIMYNLSFDGELSPCMVYLECIPKLLPFFKDMALLRYCVCILKNLCDTEEGRVSVAKTKGCISSIAEILETGSNEEKEHALAILLSLCSQRIEYCQLAMDEGIIPSLVSISKNGSDNISTSAFELLRLLREDVDLVKNEDCSEPNPGTSNAHFQGKKSSKKTGLLKKLLFFSKSS